LLPPHARSLVDDTHRRCCEVVMHWIATMEPRSTTPPVDDLLRIYLGQSSGSRAPEGDSRAPTVDIQDLWDYLGDFA
jgi:hypothetical protein